MKRFYIVVIAAAFLIGAGVLISSLPSKPRLTIFVNGSPVAYLPVTDFQTMKPRKLDATGSVAYVLDRSKRNAIFVAANDGGQTLISLPERGHTTVDLRGRLIVSSTVTYSFGVIRNEETSEQWNLTDAEATAIEAGEITLSEVQQRIQNETEG
jgi:hypothetical protein